MWLNCLAYAAYSFEKPNKKPDFMKQEFEVVAKEFSSNENLQACYYQKLFSRTWLLYFAASTTAGRQTKCSRGW